MRPGRGQPFLSSDSGRVMAMLCNDMEVCQQSRGPRVCSQVERGSRDVCVRERDGLSDEEKEEKCGWRVKKHP